MNDTFNPIGLDLTKNLHGHVRIETRDRWTGKVVDSQEKDNLITNIVSQLPNVQAWQVTSGGMFSSFTPIYQKLLGGLLLFDNTLTAQVSNTEFPASAKLVAYAGQGSNTSSAWCGSLNAPESHFTSNGFVSVWDFTTSQANGTIASLARTSHYFFMYGPAYGNSSISYYWYANSQSSNDVLTTYNILGYDRTNKYLYITPTTGGTYGGVAMTTAQLFGVKQDFFKVELQNCMPPPSQMKLVHTFTSSDGTSAAKSYVYDEYANNFVYLTGTTLHVVAMDGTHTTKSLTGTAGSGFAVTENYYWRANGGTLYRISKSDTSSKTTYTIPDVVYLAPSDNDIVFGGPLPSQYHTIIYPDGSNIRLWDYTSTSNSNNFIRVGPFYSFHQGSSSNGFYMYLKPSYLGTIANLDSPVTKSSSQTMKITYTLTEA